MNEVVETGYPEEYVPGSISWNDGWLGPPEGSKSFLMYFDMAGARQLELAVYSEEYPLSISKIVAGLDGDWEINHDTIYTLEEGWSSYEAWDSSCWATPIIQVHLSNGRVLTFECWEEEV